MADKKDAKPVAKKDALKSDTWYTVKIKGEKKGNQLIYQQ